METPDKYKITFEELVEAAKPLIKLLREKRDPMTTAIVTGWEVNLVQTEMGCPVNVSLKPGWDNDALSADENSTL